MTLLFFTTFLRLLIFRTLFNMLLELILIDLIFIGLGIVPDELLFTASILLIFFVLLFFDSFVYFDAVESTFPIHPGLLEERLLLLLVHRVEVVLGVFTVHELNRTGQIRIRISIIKLSILLRFSTFWLNILSIIRYALIVKRTVFVIWLELYFNRFCLFNIINTFLFLSLPRIINNQLI